MKIVVWMFWLFYMTIVVPMLLVILAGLFYGGIVKLMGA
jgi:hypothetical protein